MTGRVEALSDESLELENASQLEALVTRAAEAALDAEHTAGPDHVTVLLSDDARLRALNLEFNGEDDVTDVLSFNETEGWHDGVPPESLEDDMQFLAPGGEPRLGDIVISLQMTKRQADAAGVSFERELAMLTIHGVLHLLGYDHAEPQEEKRMFGKTDVILDKLLSNSD